LFEQKCLLFLYFVYTYIDNYVNDHNAIFLSYIDDISYREKNYRKKIVSTNSRIVPPLESNDIHIIYLRIEFTPSQISHDIFWSHFVGKLLLILTAKRILNTFRLICHLFCLFYLFWHQK
jgi:hypothetical protein